MPKKYSQDTVQVFFMSSVTMRSCFAARQCKTTSGAFRPAAILFECAVEARRIYSA